jgi:hypothetical protein
MKSGAAIEFTIMPGIQLRRTGTGAASSAGGVRLGTTSSPSGVDAPLRVVSGPMSGRHRAWLTSEVMLALPDARRREIQPLGRDPILSRFGALSERRAEQTAGERQYSAPPGAVQAPCSPRLCG